MDDKWIDNIREKMSEYETTPPEGLWDSVQEGLNTRKTRWWKILPAAIAASIALIIGIYISFTPVNTTIPETPLLSSATLGHKDNTGGIIENDPSAQNNPSSQQLNTGRKSWSSHESTVKDKSGTLESMDARELPKRDTQETDTVMPPEQETDHLAENTPSDETDTDKYEFYAYNEPYGNVKEKRFSIAVSTSADGMGGLINDNDLFNSQSHQMAASLDGSRMGGGIFSDSNSSNEPVATEPSPVEIFDHKLPLRFSLNLSFPLHRNLTMDTGVAYSYLRSDIQYGDANTGIWDAQQRLHYLGIPFSLRYNALSMYHCDFYLSGGAMVEKCIGGTIVGDDRSGTPYSYPGYDDRPFQFSLNAAAGIQYNFAKECGLYLEPGIGIYLDNDSPLRTIYKERPVTFNLNIGVRFSPVSRPFIR